MAIVHLVQHAEKKSSAGDPGLTALGLEQAVRVAKTLPDLAAVYSSPLRRARETAEPIAEVARLDVMVDDRLRERLNWDGSTPFVDFLADWERTTRDREFVPPGGQSSRQAGERLRSFLAEERSGRIAVVTHGGVTVDLLRTLLGDDALPTGLLTEGVPPGAITTLDGLRVVEIASMVHL